MSINRCVVLMISLVIFVLIPMACFRTRGLQEASKPSRAEVLYKRAVGHYVSGQRDSALHLYHQALKTSKKTHDGEYHVKSLMGISAVVKEENPPEALRHLEHALTIADSIHHGRLKADIMLAIAETHKGQNNYQQALEALELHNQLIDSLYRANAQREIAKLRTESRLRLERWVGTLTVTSVCIVALLLILGIRRLKRLNRTLAKNDRIKNKLFAIIGHDLRGPAGSLKMALDTVAGQGWAGDSDKMLHLFRNQASALYETIENLLQWARLQLDGLSVQHQDFDAIPAITSVLSLVDGQATEKKINIEFIHAEEVYVHMDREHFDIILRNLISNAIKFSHSGDTVTVEAAVNGTARLSIKDNGIGMTGEAFAKLKKNAAVSTFGTAGEKGSGLGFQIVNQLITLNHGIIHIDSSPEKGTVVTLTLPKAR